MKIKILFNRFKILKSSVYRSVFDFKTGYFLSKSKYDYAPLGPETMEVEVCKGNCPHKCKFCYRNNDEKESKNMTIEEFKTLVSKFPETVTQISLGITGIQSNPDIIKIIDYCNIKHIKPNITLTGIDLTEDFAKIVAPKLGGIGISVYKSKEKLAYNTFRRLKRNGAKQVGYQIIVAKETLDHTYKVINDMLKDKSIKADHLVLITPKPVEGSKFTLLDKDQYRELLKYCLKNKIDVGLDQCSKPRLKEVVSDKIINNIDSCECSFYTGFVDVNGNYWHCGFSEISENKIHEELNIFKCEDFVKDIWNSKSLMTLRDNIRSKTKDGCRLCPLFDEINYILD